MGRISINFNRAFFIDKLFLIYVKDNQLLNQLILIAE